MRYKACIFDLDGTTTDSVGAIAHTANLVLEKYGLPAQPEEAYKHFAGDGQFELIKRALRAAGDTKLEYYDAVMADYIEEFRTGCTYNVVPYDGILPMLEELKRMGIKTATLSNKRHDNVIHVVETVFGDGLFDVVMGQSDDIPKKPAPDGVYKILDKLGVDVSQCLYIGDTNTDIFTGKNAGADTVGVTWGFRGREELEEAGAVYIVDSPEQILEICR
ncbi:MAG TPA: HAD family hydrolase [Bacteroides sp.]|jgi:phosphoglycolate phosphatase|uniref:Phosphoglycolate phosphatase bacterial n=1 Tax=Bacteroides pectinophilus CAG:437 TaxID=1263051 RepID=R7APQ3_9FIRM|nr:putative uncharacterized protein [Bacteroides pectinophilus CAG:437]HBH94085.1 HAD family hydrolase [Bacteroides sp.]